MNKPLTSALARPTTTIALLLLFVASVHAAASEPDDTTRKELQLSRVTVTAKTGSDKLRAGNLSVNAVDIASAVNRLTTVNDIVARTSGVNLRREGGLGSDFDLTISGLSGNSIRYFIDGVPLDSRGSGFTLDNIPLSTVNRVEIYKGVVPASLSGDALGGAVNIVTFNRSQNYLDASYGFGSFNTHTADVAGQLRVGATPILVRPAFNINSSKNNYMMHDVEVWDDATDRYILTDRRRFHDRYFSTTVSIEAGVNRVSWADAFFVSGSFNKANKELQTGAMQNKVYGEAERHSHAWNIGVRYAKRWEKLNLTANVTHTWDHSATVDTAFRKYSWDGTWIPSNRNEINGRGRQLRVYRRPLTIVNAGASYAINPDNTLSLNYSLNRRGNKQHDDADDSYEPSSDVVAKHIIAVSFNNSLLSNRLNSTAFYKNYINSLTRRAPTKASSTNSYSGAGVASRYIFFEPLQLKASYEHSVRLPLSRELLGNGTTIEPNLDLKPETSNNYNLALFGSLPFAGDHQFDYSLTGYIRGVHNYIRAVVSERDGLMTYANEPAIHIKGLEMELSYLWSNRLSLSVNATWSDPRNMRKYKSDGNPSATYKNRVPNRPWIFGNADAAYSFRDLFSRDDRLRVSLFWQWVRWYYLNWEAYGAASSKAKIPTQSTFDLSATYSWHDNRFNLTAECNNIFNRTVYDNYMLQLPGRSLMAKFRIFIN